MENKLGKKIRDWAINFGFTLPDGSAPPADYFALLTATPHRCQLWEVLIESIQPRQKVEHMRKQIFVAKLQDMKKYSKTETSKHPTDRLNLWKKQSLFETDVKEKRDSIIKLEKIAIAKISDSVFEICKLSELEKQIEEFSEKSLLLKLIIKRKQKMMEEVEKKLSEVKQVSYLCDYGKKSREKENLDYVEKDILNPKNTDCELQNCHDCGLLEKIEELHKFGITLQCLWEDIIKYKEISMNKFSRFLENLNLNEKNVLCEKEMETEKMLTQSITQLKQKTTEKSLQVIVNSIEGKLLDSKIKKLEEKLVQTGLCDESLSDTFSFLISHERSEIEEESEKTIKNFKNYLKFMGLQSYQEFLKEELNQLEKEMIKNKRSDDECKDSIDVENMNQLTLKTCESIVEEINSIKLEEDKVVEELFCKYGQFQNLLHSLKQEIETKSNVVAEDFAFNLKYASEKQINLLLDTPLNAFRTVESSLGRILFECESASNCLNNYGGEFKQFFSAMIIPPVNDLQKILSEIEKRKKVLSEVKKFTSERNALKELQKKIQHQLNFIKYDSRLCEKNFKESDAILWSILCKTDELFREIDFIEKILKNWVEQPYRLMIN